LLLADGALCIEPEHLALGGIASEAMPAAAQAAPVGLASELWEEETRRIVAALNVHGGGRRQAAEQLGISDRTLRYKLSKMRRAGVEVPGDRGAFAGVAP
jgi:two-component system response regulator FlrC